MGRYFITGSSDGLGSLAALRLIALGHAVVLHARNAQRATDAASACPGSVAVVIGDLTSLAETKALASAANAHGPYDGVVHNAGLYRAASGIFEVNTLAPYVLTCLMAKPKRLVYLSSGLHQTGQPRLDDIHRSGYGDTKLHDVMLAKAFARRWAKEGVEAFSMDPGWVPTKMGGASATGSTEDAVDTIVMLALGEGAAKGKGGRYFFKSAERKSSAIADDQALQDRLLDVLGAISGVTAPA